MAALSNFGKGNTLIYIEKYSGYIRYGALCGHAGRWLRTVASGTMDSHLLAVSGVSSCCPYSEAELNPIIREERSRVTLPPYDLSILIYINREKQNSKIRTFDRRLPIKYVEL